MKQSPAEAAAAEAWEEAGLIGRLSDQPVGSYEYEKYRQVHRVQVFVLQVDSERSQWPEWKERTREWVTPDEAIARIEEPECEPWWRPCAVLGRLGLVEVWDRAALGVGWNVRRWG